MAEATEDRSPTDFSIRSGAYDTIGRSLLVGEQLALALELVDADSLPKARLALVAVDNLADLLLHRHAERVFESSEGSHLFPRKQYSNDERERIRASFDRMARLAQKQTDAPWGRSVEAILDQADAAVFKVAHRYRNNIYHEDRHNPAVLRPLVVLYAHAVGRAFVKGYREGFAEGVSEHRAEVLRAAGAVIEADSFMPNLLMYDYRVGAQQIADHALSGHDVPLDRVREHLSEDLLQRVTWCAGAAVGLLDEGATYEQLDRACRWSEFWEAHRHDAEWLGWREWAVELERASYVAGTDDERDRLAEDATTAAEAGYARARELQRAFVARAVWYDPDRYARDARSLARSPNMANLLSRYEKLDREVAILERTISSAVEGWDREVQHTIDVGRGK